MLRSFCLSTSACSARPCRAYRGLGVRVLKIFKVYGQVGEKRHMNKGMETGDLQGHIGASSMPQDMNVLKQLR